MWVASREQEIHQRLHRAHLLEQEEHLGFTMELVETQRLEQEIFMVVGGLVETPETTTPQAVLGLQELS